MAKYKARVLPLTEYVDVEIELPDDFFDQDVIDTRLLDKVIQEAATFIVDDTEYPTVYDEDGEVVFEV